LVEELGDKETPLSMDPHEDGSESEEEAQAVGSVPAGEDGGVGSMCAEEGEWCDEEEYDGLALAMEAFARARSLPGTKGASCAAPVEILDDPLPLPPLPAPPATHLAMTGAGGSGVGSSKLLPAVIDLCDLEDTNEKRHTSTAGGAASASTSAEPQGMSESRREARKRRRLMNAATSSQSDAAQPRDVVELEFIDHADMVAVSPRRKEAGGGRALDAQGGEGEAAGRHVDGFSIGEALSACFLPSANDTNEVAVPCTVLSTAEDEEAVNETN
jgi:hypothetical protein